MLQALFQLTQAPESDKRETAYRVFATTPDIIGNDQAETVLAAFQKGFKDEAVTVRPFGFFTTAFFTPVLTSISRYAFLPWMPSLPFLEPSTRKAELSTLH